MLTRDHATCLYVVHKKCIHTYIPPVLGYNYLLVEGKKRIEIGSARQGGAESVRNINTFHASAFPIQPPIHSSAPYQHHHRIPNADVHSLGFDSRTVRHRSLD